MSQPPRRLDELPGFLLNHAHGFMEASCIFAITDVRGTIVFANEGFCRISGYSQDELVGQNHRILKSGRHPPEFYRELWITIARGETWRGEICNRAKDGREYWVESTISPVFGADRRITHYCALRVDVTDRKQARDELLLWMHQDAEAQRLEAVGRLADGVCHDLNNMLGSALVFSDLLSATGDQREILRGMLLRMAGLVRNLRDIATGRPVEKRRFGIGRIVRESCRMASFRAVAEQKLRLDLDVSAIEDCEIEGNEGQIFEVFINLVQNAIESTDTVERAHLLVRGVFDAAGAMVHVYVADNGPGVSEPVRGALFEPGVSTKGRGRGAGLAMARRIAREHAGDLVLDSSTRGAVFRLSLPGTLRAGEPMPPVPDGLVLVVDDDELVVFTVEKALQAHGFRTMVARDASRLLLTAEEERRHLAAAIVDSVGLVDEFSFVGYLRSINPSMPVILTSAKLSMRGVKETRHGRVYMLPKPFNVRDLVDAVTSRCGAPDGPEGMATATPRAGDVA